MSAGAHVVAFQFADGRVAVVSELNEAKVIVRDDMGARLRVGAFLRDARTRLAYA